MKNSSASISNYTNSYLLDNKFLYFWYIFIFENHEYEFYENFIKFKIYQNFIFIFLQFCAMLMHRFGTLAHIIASTEFSCCKKQADRLTEDDLVVQNAVEIARELQAIRGIDDSFTPEALVFTANFFRFSQFVSIIPFGLLLFGLLLWTISNEINKQTTFLQKRLVVSRHGEFFII